MVDQKTAYLQLPLPHLDNAIDEDCPRVRQALTQMVDQKTAHLQLPLPHLDNAIDEDCPRVRQALTQVDGHAEQTDRALAAHVGQLDAQQMALERQEAALSRVAEIADDATLGIQTETAARQSADAGHDAELAALAARLDALAAAVSAIKVDPWDVFPPCVPIPVQNVAFGGSDGRRAILPGETQARENWIICDGGGDGRGGLVPDLRGRMILGASASRPAGSAGGSETHAHSVSGTVGATTLSVAQLASHAHTVYAAQAVGGNQNGGNGSWPSNQNIMTNSTGSSQPHTHSLTGSSGAANNLPPWYTLAYIMRIA